MIETTAYIDDEIRRKLDMAARTRSVSRSALVVSLMRRVMKEHGKKARLGRTVQYQETSENRRCAHVSLSERDYECFIDMRRFFKRSVSLLISYAVIRFLDELFEEIDFENTKYYTDNNLFNNYLLSCTWTESYVCWIISWGIPDTIP